jgi:hypothetical protein
MQKLKIFYSWQSDRDNNKNRGLIGKALENAVNKINKENPLELIEVDRDTQGVGGSPDISQTIFQKIDVATMFVADVTFINDVAEENRLTPNPNVLIELGYAYKTLGPTQVILVLNSEYGKPEHLPFDLKMKRAMVYNTSNPLPDERKKLEGQLESQIRVIIEEIKKKFQNSNQQSKIEVLKKSIYDGSSDRKLLLRDYISGLVNNLIKKYPGRATTDDYDEKLIEAIEGTKDEVREFKQVIEAIADNNDESSLLGLYQGFKPLLHQYDNPVGFSGTFDRRDFDYFKFVGNEMFVLIISVLLKDQKWDLIKKILEENIIVNNVRHQRKSVDYTYFNQGILSLGHRNTRLKLNRVSIMADMLVKRREYEGQNSSQEYLDADFFLFIKGESSNKGENADFSWYPFTSVYLKDVPEFLLWSQKKSIASNIVGCLSLENVAHLKKILTDYGPQIGNNMGSLYIWDYPIRKEDVDAIATK